MRICLLGDTGSGKTMTAIYILYDYFKRGFKVYSNIKLLGELEKNYTSISNTGFIDVVNENVKNVILLDEVGKTTYEKRTHNAIRLGDLVTQSRKSIGEDSHLIFTTQLESQLNEVLISLSDFLIYSHIILRLRDLNPKIDLKRGKIPYLISLHLKEKRISNEGISYFHTHKNPYYLEKDFRKISTLYNTYEEVSRFGDGEYISLQKKYKEYVGKKLKKTELKIKLQFKEHLNISESNRIATAIIMGLKDD